MSEIISDLLWYIESERTDGIVQSGTGIRVRLKAPGNSEFQNFVLTCLHVIYEFDEFHRPKTLEPGRVKCWPEGGVYDERYGMAAAVMAQAAAFRVPAQSLTPENDWVLLSLDEQRAAEFHRNNRPVVLRETVVEKGESYLVYGYPDGAAKFKSVQSISGEIKVQATRSAEMTLFHRTSAAFRLEGTGTRAGMSGGAVFDSRGAITGLLRAGFDAQLDREVVSIGWIVNELRERHFEFPSFRNVLEATQVRKQIGIDSVVQNILSTPKDRLSAKLTALLSTVGLSGMLTKDEFVCEELGRLDPGPGERAQLIESGISLLSGCGSHQMPLRLGDVDRYSSSVAFSRDLYRIAGRIGAPAEAALCAATLILYPTAKEATRRFVELCSQYGNITEEIVLSDTTFSQR